MTFPRLRLALRTSLHAEEAAELGADIMHYTAQQSLDETGQRMLGYRLRRMQAMFRKRGL